MEASGKKRIVVIEGEDAAPEAVRPTLELIDQLGLPIEWVHPPVGQAGLARCGELFPDVARRAIDESAATLFGAAAAARELFHRPADSQQARDTAKPMAQARAGLSAPDWDAAFGEGRRSRIDVALLAHAMPT